MTTQKKIARRKLCELVPENRTGGYGVFRRLRLAPVGRKEGRSLGRRAF